MTEAAKPFGLRMPADIRDWLSRQAEVNRRSMNSEILKMLQDAKQAAEGTTPAHQLESK